MDDTEVFISNNKIKEQLNVRDFLKEIDLQTYIIDNIDLFCIDILGDELLSFEYDYAISEQYKFSPRGRRVDLYIKCKQKNYIIELKNPSQSSENRSAIGQLLDYGREFSKAQMILITTKFDLNTAKTIKYFNLPIRYIYFDKLKSLEFKRVISGDEHCYN